MIDIVLDAMIVVPLIVGALLWVFRPIPDRGGQGWTTTASLDDALPFIVEIERITTERLGRRD